MLKEAIEKQNEELLEDCLDFNNKFSQNEFELIEKALIATWHSQHEDIVGTIYLDGLIDDRFVEPILNIALKKDTYRPHDFDLESCLRKCVHALKTINSSKSKLAIEELIKLKNPNVEYALEVYK